MKSNLCAFLVLLAISLVYAAILWAILDKNLRGLIDKVVKIPEAASFYASAFGIALLSVIFSKVFDTAFQFKADAHKMEYVWQVADGLAGVLENAAYLLAIFLFIVTLLVMVLKRKNDA